MFRPKLVIVKYIFLNLMAKNVHKNKNKGITLIKKSNQLIESRYKFDIWETRVFLSVLSRIGREDEDFKPYRIYYKDVIKVFGLKSAQSYALLREAAKGLMRKVFTVSSFDNGFQRETEYHIIRTINYLKDGEAGAGVTEQEYIDITFDPEMKPFLLQLQMNFTAYDLRNIIKLGAYPVRIYELLKQYENIGTRTLKIDEMKRMFELTEEYPLFANFYQKIIAPSVKEINEHTDITISKMEQVKEGRKVVALCFNFHPKKESEMQKMRGDEHSAAPNLLPEKTLILPARVGEETEKDRLFNLFQEDVVQNFGVTASVFVGLLGDISEEQIMRAVRVTKRAKLANQIKTNAAGFFVQALKNNYTDQKEEEEKKKRLENDHKKREAKLKEDMEQLRDEQAVSINDRIREVTTKMPNITEKAIEALNDSTILRGVILDKEQALGRTLEVEDYRHDKMLREIVKGKIMELEPEQFAEILQNFEDKKAGLVNDFKRNNEV